ncbi:MAG: hypothetical protein R6W89_00445, partial [Candidatus Hydrogenedentota bacterium]
ALDFAVPREDDVGIGRDFRLLAADPVTSRTRYRVESWPGTVLDPELPDWRGYAPNPHDDWLNNIGDDLGQRENLVSEEPGKAAELRTLLRDIRESKHTAPRLTRTEED